MLHKKLNIKTILPVMSVLLAVQTASVTAQEPELEDYLELSLESLLETTVSSVSKKRQSLLETTAAVYVISSEQIRRSSYRTIPDLLRMVPGLQVAKIDANTWAVTSRGFNDSIANKLLVLQDGRALYNPIFSGVYWEAQDMVLDDIERIEIIRGPGAAIWGANAVNGVINIITKTTGDSLGGLAKVSAGTDVRGAATVRYGFELNEATQGRIYLKGDSLDSNKLFNSDVDANDAGETLHGGFRLDSQLSAWNRWTLQGDFYDISQGQINSGLVSPDSPMQLNQDDTVISSGWNLLSRWEHQYQAPYGGDGFTSLQVYYDHNQRDELVIGLEYDTFDLELLNHQMIAPNHEVTWGLGYRHIWDEFSNTFRVSVTPSELDYSIVNAFIQDEVALTSNIHLTVGAKLESHQLHSTELQPSIRLYWGPDDKSSLWAAISRAVRTPSRFERNGNILATIIPMGPPLAPVLIPLTINGSETFVSEELIAYEAGYRSQLSDRLTLDLALFYNDYDQLLSFEMPAFGSTVFGNLLEGSSYGAELSSTWRMKEWWKLSFGYSYINLSMRPKAASMDVTAAQMQEGSAPRSQLFISSAMDLSNDWELDLSAKYVSGLDKTQPGSADSSVDSYTNLNARLSWQAQENVRLSLVGQNLLSAENLEYIGQSFIPSVEIERSILGQIQITF